MRKLMFITMVCAFMAVPVWGGMYTTVAPGSASEADLWQVLNLVTTSGINVDQAGLNSGAGGLRVYDSPTNPGEYYDQFWMDGAVDVTATALWWGGTASEGSNVNQRFMYDDNINGLSRTYIGPSPTWVSGDSGTFSIGTSDPFIIGVDGNSDAWSRESLNTVTGSPSRKDRMVTFDVSGMDIYAWISGTYSAPSLTQIRNSTDLGSAYIVGFDTGSDGDYQDFIALIEGPVPVPVPGAVLLGLLGLSAAGIKLRKHA